MTTFSKENVLWVRKNFASLTVLYYEYERSIKKHLKAFKVLSLGIFLVSFRKNYTMRKKTKVQNLAPSLTKSSKKLFLAFEK
jgi:hypothetical protein